MATNGLSNSDTDLDALQVDDSYCSSVLNSINAYFYEAYRALYYLSSDYDLYNVTAEDPVICGITTN